ncbi:MAG: MarR family transcriptional regulator [Chloroflexi bacterium]|nr:MarR family transcriptional regulator [Chloroflexota bacterium]
MTQSDTPNSEKRQKWMAFVQTISPTIDPHAVRLMDELRMVSRTLYQIGESSLTAAGLSYAQYRILLGLHFAQTMEDRSELNPSEISKRQGTSRNTISSLIRSLEDEGLVERHLDHNDRRKFNICLTPAGQQKVSDHASRHMDIVGTCFGSLSKEEQSKLGDLLAKLSKQISAAKEINTA